MLFGTVFKGYEIYKLFPQAIERLDLFCFLRLLETISKVVGHY